MPRHGDPSKPPPDHRADHKESLSDALWSAYRASPRPKPCAKELMEVIFPPRRAAGNAAAL